MPIQKSKAKFPLPNRQKTIFQDMNHNALLNRSDDGSSFIVTMRRDNNTNITGIGNVCIGDEIEFLYAGHNKTLTAKIVEIISLKAISNRTKSATQFNVIVEHIKNTV